MLTHYKKQILPDVNSRVFNTLEGCAPLLVLALVLLYYSGNAPGEVVWSPEKGRVGPGR